MTMTDLIALTDAVRAIIERQEPDVVAWHEAAPDGPTAPAPAADAGVLAAIASAQHATNFALWHVEDEARRTDVGPEVIADCKRRIDALNQRRNDLIEQVDACLLLLLDPLLPATALDIHNTETVGMALDRLSILALKVYHMAEQAGRAEATDEHRAACARKLDVLREQRTDLTRSIVVLLAEYVAGTRRPKVYYQFKMYNDPALNPALYGAAAKAGS